MIEQHSFEEDVRRQHRQLERLYNDGQAVAYIDETFHVKEDGRQRFYVMCAVVVPHESIDQLRTRFETIVTSFGSESYWHTSSAVRTSEGRRKWAYLLRELNQSDAMIMFQQTTVIGDEYYGAEPARKQALTSLITNLNEGMPKQGLPSVKHICIERRKNNDAQVDARTLANLKRQTLGRHSAYAMVSPAVEPLLWLPDMAAYALRQVILYKEHRPINIIRDSIIKKSDSPVKRQMPQPALAKRMGPATATANQKELNRHDGTPLVASILSDNTEETRRMEKSNGKPPAPDSDFDENLGMRLPGLGSKPEPGRQPSKTPMLMRSKAAQPTLRKPKL